MSRIIFLFFFILTACSSSNTYAPVTDLNGIEKIPRAGRYRVAKGETLYSIAFRFGLDYRTLAAWNHIHAPYTIQRNQWIALRANQPVMHHQASVPVVQPKMVKQEEREPAYSVSGWRWPARGRIINSFSASNKGVNIAGRKGEPIYAAGSGKVVYSGNGLRSYGNLIIIKHNNLYLSAYAHCLSVLVKDGDWVRQGQKIAEMGNTDSGKTLLHFEIRRAGKPIDPTHLSHPVFS